jgi:hypothetical protein
MQRRVAFDCRAGGLFIWLKQVHLVLTTCCVYRYGGIAWCDDDLALLYESHWDSRKSRTWIFAPGDPLRAPKLLFDRNFEDIYTDPGNPVGVRHAEWCTTVLARVDGEDKLLMEGAACTLQVCDSCQPCVRPAGFR